MTPLLLLLLSNILAVSNTPSQPRPSARQNPPAAGIREFEDSAFCEQYKCRLETIAEMPRQASSIESRDSDWDYEYRIQGNNLAIFRMRLSSKGERRWPLVEIRWSPLNDKVVLKDNVRIQTSEVHAEDFAFVPDLVGEIVGPKMPRIGAAYNCARITCRVCPDMTAPCDTIAGKFDISTFLANYLRSIDEGYDTGGYASVGEFEFRTTVVKITNKDESRYLELTLGIAKKQP